MNISSGKIELNGVSFGSNTSVDELIGNPQFHSCINNGGPVDIFTSQQVTVDRYTFNIKIFFINKRLDKIQLTPVNLEMKAPGYPDEEYQRKKKKVADSFLRAKLGEPQKANGAVLYYEFEWGSVSSVAFLGGRNEYSGGFIEISYKK